MERIFILDRSGSMASCWDDTIGGYNSFVESQKELGGTITLVQFDHDYTVLYTAKPITEVEPLTRQTFVPRGSTALLDAMGQAIKDYKSPTAPTVIVLTDGLENASKTYTKAHIKDLVEQKEKDGWVFMYLGANHDAFGEAESLGIAPGRTLNYDANNTPNAFTQLSAALSRADSQFV
jgi:Mg-chelatase subunit ChlD